MTLHHLPLPLPRGVGNYDVSQKSFMELFAKTVNGFRPWQIKFSVMYVHVLAFYIICLLTYFCIKIFVRVNQKIWSRTILVLFPQKSSIVDVWLGSEYVSASFILGTFYFQRRKFRREMIESNKEWIFANVWWNFA